MGKPIGGQSPFNFPQRGSNASAWITIALALAACIIWAWLCIAGWV